MVTFILIRQKRIQKLLQQSIKKKLNKMVVSKHLTHFCHLMSPVLSTASEFKTLNLNLKRQNKKVTLSLNSDAGVALA